MQAGRAAEPVASKPGARPSSLQRYRGPVKKRLSRKASDARASSSRRRNARPVPAVSAPSWDGTSERIVRLRVVCKAPPDPDQHGANFGLQVHSTAAHWTLQAGIRKTNGDSPHISSPQRYEAMLPQTRLDRSNISRLLVD